MTTMYATHPRQLIAVICLLLGPVTSAAAQSVAQSVTQSMSDGDRAVLARNAEAALAAYELAIAADSNNIGALQKAAKVAVALAEFAMPRPSRAIFRNKGDAYARRAFLLDSTSAESHFVMAQAIGRSAQGQPPNISMTYGALVHTHAQRCLRIQPTHAGCAHVIGEWNATLMRFNVAIRKLAAMTAKSPVYEAANWDTAQVYLERAVAREPNRIVHRLALGRIYADRGYPDKAREQFLAAEKAPLLDFNDGENKKQAEVRLKGLLK